MAVEEIEVQGATKGWRAFEKMTGEQLNEAGYQSGQRNKEV